MCIFGIVYYIAKNLRSKVNKKLSKLKKCTHFEFVLGFSIKQRLISIFLLDYFARLCTVHTQTLMLPKRYVFNLLPVKKYGKLNAFGLK